MNIIRKLLIREKYKSFNRKLFKKVENKNINILIEFNAFNESHVCQMICKIFSKKI